MTLRVLALGDAHFMVKNIAEVNIFLAKLETYLAAHKEEIDLIISLGDVLDTHANLHTIPLNKAIEYVKLLASYKPTYALVGNHDGVNNSIFLTNQHWLNCLKGWPGVTVVDEVIIASHGGHKLVLCPYVPDGRFLEALDTRKGEWEDAACIFSHVTIKGANMGSMIAKEADPWNEGFPMLVSGHIHLSQYLYPNMFYTGSIMQVAVDESPKKHLSYVSIGGQGLPRIEAIDLHLPKKERIFLDIAEIADFKLPAEPDTKYTLYLSGKVEDFRAFRKSTAYKQLNRLPQLAKNGIKFKHIPEEKNSQQEFSRGKPRHFNELLLETVSREQDELLLSCYKALVFGEPEDASELLAPEQEE